MKKFFAITALVIFSSTVASAQSAPPRDTDNTATRNNDEPRHNWSWIGLLGLAGLAGLGGRKSQQVRRLEQSGANVKSV